VTGPPVLVVDIQVACDGHAIPAHSEIERWARLAAESGAQAAAAGAELSIRLVDAGESRALNRDYRGKDKPTNVLSFPAGPIAGLPPGEPRLLGDLVICPDVVAAEADAAGLPPGDHWAHIVVHGVLHLLGYDHETASDAAVMEGLETRLLTARGLADPYGADDA